jgi:hypothetical protein
MKFGVVDCGLAEYAEGNPCNGPRPDLRFHTFHSVTCSLTTR